MCEICSMLSMKTAEQRHLRHSDVFIVKFEYLFLETLLLTLNK